MSFKLENMITKTMCVQKSMLEMTEQLVFPASAGASYNLDDSRARAYCACSRCGWGLFGHFYSPYLFFSLSPSLWETVRYRLKYCLKGPLNPKQPTNQPTYFRCLGPHNIILSPSFFSVTERIIFTFLVY